MGPAQAAHWAVTYDCNGSSTGYDLYTNQPFNVPWLSGAYPSCGYAYWSQGQTSGTITPVLTWTPDPSDVVMPPAPTEIIAKVDTIAQAYLYGQGTGMTAQASDSLDGDGTQSVTSWLVSNFVSGTHYLVVDNPTAQTSVTMDPISASASSYGGGYGGYGGVGVSVTPFPLLLDIYGGIGSTSTKHFMIGQSVYAALNKGNLPDLPTDTYSWSVAGGKPFDNYAAFTDHATYFPLFSTQPNTGFSMACYFAKPDIATFTCQANLMGLPITLTKDVILEKPSAELSVQIGSVVDDGNASNPSGITLALPGYVGTVGIKWTGNILTPSGFDGYEDVGQWNWTQLVISKRQQIINGQVQQVALDNTDPATSIFGVQCLDNFYPYADTDGWYPADGTDNGNSDAPNAPFTSDASVTQIDTLDSFHDYLMYLPPHNNVVPPSDSVVVPLKETSWFWQGQGLQAGGIWTTSNKNAQWGFDGDFPDHPVWTFPLINDEVVFAP